MKNMMIVLCLSCAFSLAQGQNLLPSDHWTVGVGSITNFIKWGDEIENSRVQATTPYGSSGVLWKATNCDGESGSCDGGWVSAEVSIDHTEDYRFTVWMKKTNSFDGTSYFGCGYWGEATVASLGGTTSTNPYFFASDLPSLNEWYLLVAYVWNSNSQESANKGGIYDLDTYSKVVTLTDYKFLSSATKIRHRAFNWYDPNLSDVQYLYAPRIDKIDGSEPTIDDLLRYDLTAATKTVYFNYDESGNRIERYLGEVVVGRSSKIPAGEGMVDTTFSNDQYVIKTPVDDEIAVTIYPNPTKGLMKVDVVGVFDFSDSGFEVIDFSGRQLLSSSSLSSSQNINIESFPSGNYVLKVRIQGKDYEWKIIKK